MTMVRRCCGRVKRLVGIWRAILLLGNGIYDMILFDNVYIEVYCEVMISKCIISYNMK